MGEQTRQPGVLRDEGTEGLENQARADQIASVTVPQVSQLEGAAKSLNSSERQGREAGCSER